MNSIRRTLEKYGCFAVAGSGNLDCLSDCLKYQAILAKTVMPSVQRLKLDDQWAFLQDSHPKVYIQIYLSLVLQGSFVMFSSGLFSLQI